MIPAVQADQELFPQASGYCAPIVGEEIPMTLQVALVGSDGVLLASDTKYGMTNKYRHTFVATKIRIDRERGIALAYAGNDLGIIAARSILTDLTAEDFAFSLELPLERIVRKR